MGQPGETTSQLNWCKSSHSGSDGGDCVEVAIEPDTVYVRDSKMAGVKPVLRVGRGKWAAFLKLASQ